ncbi:FecR family protein [Sphingobacterium sp. LRF_L2]|uniref:FecR family protein n=1 Tax=Sphingobacterium sp. LRF_L2 TaxID=3369421 RepID=UPI003F5E0626
MSTKIVDIYIRYLQGNISRIELDILFQFFEQATAEELQELIHLGFDEEQMDYADTHLELSLQRVQGKLMDYTFQPPARIIHWKSICFSIAASLLVIFGFYFLFLSRSPKTAKDILAPSPSLFVRNAKGQQFTIDKQADSIWTSDQITYQLVDSQTLRLSAKEEALTPTEQTFYTDRSDFQLILDDGSAVTLNAHSTLTLKIPFEQNQRKVALLGEGFFDIAHDSNRPFRVQAGSSIVEVLGTQFNIRNYPEDKQVETSLIRGKIALSQEGRQERIILSPGEKALSDAKGITLVRSGTKQAVAWKDRYFAYEDQPISKILMDLARWYNIEVDTQDMPKNKTIYMKINKNLPLSEVLNLMGETSNLSYSFENGKISVHEQKEMEN